MAAYINGLACIAHYSTFDENYFFENAPAIPAGSSFAAAEPVYSNYIPAGNIRRMSHILKMGISTAMMSIRSAGIENVDAIITGTGMGCVEDTDVFLRAIIDNNEELLTPTSFIRSTHNTVGGQIALLLKCTGYNFTYVHQNLSFEYALLDAMLMLEEDNTKTILTGGLDEITPALVEIFNRSGNNKDPGQKLPVWDNKSKGYSIGEGAAFFVLNSVPDSGKNSRISGVKCIQMISGASELMKEVEAFLSSIGLKKAQISLVLAGNCGDNYLDKNINEFNNEIGVPVAYFKHLCGEYFTAGSFAVWLAASILLKQIVPEVILPENISIPVLNHILIVNHYQNKQYSVICVSA